MPMTVYSYILSYVRCEQKMSTRISSLLELKLLHFVLFSVLFKNKKCYFIGKFVFCMKMLTKYDLSELSIFNSCQMYHFEIVKFFWKFSNFLTLNLITTVLWCYIFWNSNFKRSYPGKFWRWRAMRGLILSELCPVYSIHQFPYISNTFCFKTQLILIVKYLY